MYLLKPELSVQFKLCETAFPARVEFVEFKKYLGGVVSAVVVVDVVVDVEVVVASVHSHSAQYAAVIALHAFFSQVSPVSKQQ
jgi:hypothetical protein